MHRFIIDERIIDGRAPLSKQETAHALKVLRLKDGSEIEVADGAGGVYNARLCVERDGRAHAQIIEALKSAESNVRVTLYQALPKADKLELIVQKLTELGAKRVVPVRARRCVMRMDAQDVPAKLIRLARISREAGKQCGRAEDMHIAPPIDFDEMLCAFAAHDVILAPWELARGTRIRHIHAERPDATDIAYIIGPEGGFAPDEAQALERAGARLVTLGPRILRAETAAVATCAIIMSLWGDI